MIVPFRLISKRWFLVSQSLWAHRWKSLEPFAPDNNPTSDRTGKSALLISTVPDPMSRSSVSSCSAQEGSAGTESVPSRGSSSMVIRKASHCRHRCLRSRMTRKVRIPPSNLIPASEDSPYLISGGWRRVVLRSRGAQSGTNGHILDPGNGWRQGQASRRRSRRRKGQDTRVATVRRPGSALHIRSGENLVLCVLVSLW